MPRSYAPVFTSIWQDRDFVSLTADAQRVYLLALSQPNVSYCGVVPYTERRWSRMAGDTNTEVVGKAVAELQDRRFVLLDEETEELLIRSFVKHNRVLEQPQLGPSLRRDFTEILSPVIRGEVLAVLPDPLQDELRKTCSEPSAQAGPSLPGILPGTLRPGRSDSEGLGTTRGSRNQNPNRDPDLDHDRDLNPDPPSERADSRGSATQPPADKGARKRAHRIPDDFQITNEMREWAQENTGLNRQRIDREADQFIDVWRGSGKPKADWVATWRVWIRRAEGEGGRSTSRGSSRPEPEDALVELARERGLS